MRKASGGKLYSGEELFNSYRTFVFFPLFFLENIVYTSYSVWREIDHDVAANKRLILQRVASGPCETRAKTLVGARFRRLADATMLRRTCPRTCRVRFDIPRSHPWRFMQIQFGEILTSRYRDVMTCNMQMSGSKSKETSNGCAVLGQCKKYKV